MYLYLFILIYIINFIVVNYNINVHNWTHEILKMNSRHFYFYKILNGDCLYFKNIYFFIYQNLHLRSLENNRILYYITSLIEGNLMFFSNIIIYYQRSYCVFVGLCSRKMRKLEAIVSLKYDIFWKRIGLSWLHSCP